MEKRETNNLKLEKLETNAIENDKLFCGSFKAYFSTYNTVNLRPDRMLKGCFASEIERFANGEKLPRLLAQHRSGSVIGIVTGIFDDEFGAIVEAKFINTSLGRDMYIAFKSGAIDELSFAFYVTDSAVDKEGVRNVIKVEGIEEISLVTWGMDNKTKPIEINSKDLTIRDAEKALKNIGFETKQAKTILSGGFNSLNRDEEKEQRDAETRKVFNKGIDKLINELKGE